MEAVTSLRAMTGPYQREARENSMDAVGAGVVVLT
jgi:hypothetical protein